VVLIYLKMARNAVSNGYGNPNPLSSPPVGYDETGFDGIALFAPFPIEPALTLWVQLLNLFHYLHS
jgi:hypothetical protein